MKRQPFTRQLAHPKAIKLLVEAGLDIHARNKNGNTALHKAVAWGQSTAVKLLLNAGSDVHARCHHGKTALYWATVNEHIEIIQLLLRAEIENGTRKKVIFYPVTK